MFQNLSLRAKLIAIAVPPLVVLACVAIYGLLLSINGAQENLVGDVRTLSIIALAGLILTTIVGVMVFRTVVDPVDEITAATRDLADNRLPRLVDALRTNNAAATEFPPIKFEQNDELGDLANALNDVQNAATTVAVEQQDLIRKGVSEIVINMARRNQTLLDRQIEYIDTLESAEEDPERLEQLFGLDHLATRMRRNAESLLVLAGAESARRRGGPVAVADVLRVAMSEIEDYRHVQLHAVEQCDIAAASAVDLAHLLSELMENSTQFSPPDAPVEVSGTTHPDGSYLISIVDHGIGMNAEQLLAANSTIANPPELGLNLSRSLGFIVVGRLAQRLNVRIELVQSSGGGVTAIIEVPQTALNGGVGDDSQMPAQDAAGAMGVAALEAPASMTPTPEAPAAPALNTPGMPLVNEPAPALNENPFGSSDLGIEEEAWTPPSVPERGANPIGGAPASEMPAPAGMPAESDALAKLKGLGPDVGMPDVAAPSFDAPSFDAPSIDAPSIDTPSFEAPSFEAPAIDTPSFEAPSFEAPAMDTPSFDAPSFEAPAMDTPSFDAPSFEAPAMDTPSMDTPSFDAPAMDLPNAPEMPEPFEQVQPGPAPTKLEEAIPTGEAFDQGMDDLLGDGPGRTSTGLVKRDRSKSSAPQSEGRQIPDPSATAAAASSRSPEEIRSMLARYREGLKGRPLEGLAQEAPDSSTETNPFGDHA